MSKRSSDSWRGGCSPVGSTHAPARLLAAAAADGADGPQLGTSDHIQRLWHWIAATTGWAVSVIGEEDGIGSSRALLTASDEVVRIQSLNPVVLPAASNGSVGRMTFQRTAAGTRRGRGGAGGERERERERRVGCVCGTYEQCLQRHLLEILVHRAAVVAYVCNHNTKHIMDKVQCP